MSVHGYQPWLCDCGGRFEYDTVTERPVCNECDSPSPSPRPPMVNGFGVYLCTNCDEPAKQCRCGAPR